jgi:hypothetical protein
MARTPHATRASQQRSIGNKFNKARSQFFEFEFHCNRCQLSPASVWRYVRGNGGPADGGDVCSRGAVNPGQCGAAGRRRGRSKICCLAACALFALLERKAIGGWLYPRSRCGPPTTCSKRTGGSWPLEISTAFSGKTPASSAHPRAWGAWASSHVGENKTCNGYACGARIHCLAWVFVLGGLGRSVRLKQLEGSTWRYLF